MSLKRQMDPTTTAVVHDIVDNFVDNQKMFTAWEVAFIASDKRGADVVRSVMKQEVHNYFNQGGMGNDYTRTTADVGAAQRAFVYHPQGDDPNFYKPLDRDDADDANPAADVVDGAIVDRIVDEEDDDDEDDNQNNNQNKNQLNVDTDQWGRIRVPTKVLRKLNVKPGQKVKVGVDAVAKALVLSKDQTSGLSGTVAENCEYVVDRYGNIRIGKPRLQKAGVNDKLLTIDQPNADMAIITKRFVS
jgi:bifunctional DNA-binding transcriptional regulator/antitoxin component of YhaV-PrlF toxin-antitoxin module